MASLGSNFFQLVAAAFIGALLAHVVLKVVGGKEGFERFPPPLVSMGPQVPQMVQGRDYIPHKVRPTAAPGPAVPFAVDLDGSPRETVPPVPGADMPGQTRSPAQAPLSTPFPMTVDSFDPGPSFMMLAE
jgi:hypothetical protein